MPRRRGGRAPAGSSFARAALVLLALLALAAACHLAAFWPGIIGWDAIRQYRQALTGHYDDWHPPAMNWLWRQLRRAGDGPAPMLMLQALLYWAGFAAILLGLARERRWLRVIAIGVLAVLPVSLVLLGSVLKDSLMAGALLLATGLISWRRPGDWLLGLLAAVLLLAAATLRFNAAPACVPLALLLVPPRWIARPRRLLLAGAIAAIPLLLALPLANRLLAADRSQVELSLIIYDLGGITRFSNADAFPPLPLSDPVAINRRCYSATAWDSYAWWVDQPCAIGFTQLAPAFAAPAASAPRWWLGAVVRHPLAYAEHRLAHFNRDIRFMPGAATLPPLAISSDPNPWHYQLSPSPLRPIVTAAAAISLHTPLGWPACWLALAAGVLLAGAGGNRLAAALAASSLLYGFSYLPLGVASELRYHLWTMISAGLAAAIGLGRRDPGGRRRPPLAGWRIVAAGALPATILLLASAGHA